MQIKPTVALYLDTRRTLKNGKFPLKVRVTFHISGKWLQKYYSTRESLSEVQWEKVRSGSVPFALRRAREEALKMEAKANDIISTNPAIKPDLFEALFIGKYSNTAGVGVLFDETITRLEGEGRIGTAESYKCAKVSLMAYKGDFPLEVVDEDFLREYERWMVAAGKSLTTVGMYLRAFRVIYNLAADRRMISKDLYPFGPKKYVIPKGSSVKKALDRKQKTRLETGQTESAQEKRALSMWMMSYYCNGMNFTDIAHLKPENDHGEFISFVRRKTMRTVRQIKPIIVPVRQEVREIINTYGGQAPYLFGILNDQMTAKQQHSRVHDWIRLTNKYVNRVAKRLGFQGKINTYAARHTFATALLNANANPKEISESLGHSSLAVTEAYLKGLDVEKAKKLSKLL